MFRMQIRISDTGLNKHNKIDEDYKPDDLVLPEYRASDRPDGNQYLRRRQPKPLTNWRRMPGRKGIPLRSQPPSDRGLSRNSCMTTMCVRTAEKS